MKSGARLGIFRWLLVLSLALGSFYACKDDADSEESEESAEEGEGKEGEGEGKKGEGEGKEGEGDEAGEDSAAAEEAELGMPKEDGPKVVNIEAGREATCARLDNGSVKCWGRNDDGEMGTGSEGGETLAPTPANVEGTTALWFDNGYGYGGGGIFGGRDENTGCAAFEDGSIKCWGSNEGMFGNGETKNSAEPIAIAELKGVKDVALGEGAGCGAAADGKVLCWGSAAFEVLGRKVESGFGREKATEVPGLTGATATACGQNHCCALKEGGELVCWGYNIGETPTAVEGAPAGITAIDAEGRFTCALGGDGSVHCGQPGSAMKPVEGATGLTSLSIELNEGCGIDGDGGLHCWCNQKDYSQFECEKNFTAQTISAPGKVTDVSVGDGHTCILLEDGRVMCRGANRRGQLGDGTLEDRDEFAVVPHMYEPPETPVALPAMVPEEPATWNENLPEGCVETAAPEGQNFDVRWTHVVVEEDRNGGNYHSLYLANHERDPEKLRERPRGKQAMVRLILRKEKILDKTGDNEVRELIPLEPGTYTEDRKGTERADGDLLYRDHGAKGKTTVELKYVGADYLCGTFEVTEYDKEPVKARFAVPMSEEAAAAAGPVDSGERLAPTPEPQALGDKTLWAQPCRFDGYSAVAKSTMDVSTSVAVANDKVYILDDKGRILAFNLAEENGCVLTPDTAFGKEGSLLPPKKAERLDVDDDGNLWVAAQGFNHFKVSPTGELLTDCNATGNMTPAPSGEWSVGHFGSTVSEITYSADACEKKELEGKPFKSVMAMDFIDEKTYLLGGSLEDGPKQFTVMERGKAEPIAPMMGGTGDMNDDDYFGWIHDVAACPAGYCALDSNFRKMVAYDTKSHEMVGMVKLNKLLGLKYPWVNDMHTVGDNLWVIASNKHDEAESAEAIVYKIGGFKGEAAPEMTDMAAGAAPAVDGDGATEDGAADGAPAAEATPASVTAVCKEWDTSVKKFGDDCSALGKRLQRKFRGKGINFSALPDTPEFEKARERCKKAAIAMKGCASNKEVVEAFKEMTGSP